MLSMPQPFAITRLTLLPAMPPRGPEAVKIRRYRLASVRPTLADDAATRSTQAKRAPG